MTASVATYPHEVVRTRLQTQRRLLLPSGLPRKRSGIVRTTRKIIHFEGWRGLYKGLSVNLIRTVPNSAVTMLTCVFFAFGGGPSRPTGDTQWFHLYIHRSCSSHRYELLMRQLAVRRR